MATIDRIFLKANCTPFNVDANKVLGELLEKLAIEIMGATKDLANLAGRKTINDADITLAYDQWKQKRAFKHSIPT